MCDVGELLYDLAKRGGCAEDNVKVGGMDLHMSVHILLQSLHVLVVERIPYGNAYSLENRHGEFPMNKPISLAILAGGILLVIFGIDAVNSTGSDISRFFTGAPTDRAMWMLVGGVIASVIGLAGLLLPGSKAA